MSQAPATHPARRHVRRRPASSHQRLRVVQGRAAARRSWFPVLCLSLLAAGLLAVLVLNAALAQGSFELGHLQAVSSELADRQESLSQGIDEQRSPEHLASRARALGMVPATSPAFLRLSDGKVLGVARPASSDDGFAVAPTTPSAPAPTSGAPDGQRGTTKDTKKETKKDVRRNGQQADTKKDPKKNTGQTSGTDRTPGTSGRTSGGGATSSTTEGP